MKYRGLERNSQDMVWPSFLSIFFQKIVPCNQSPEVWFLCAPQLIQMCTYRLIKPFVFTVFGCLSILVDCLSNSRLKVPKLVCLASLSPVCEVLKLPSAPSQATSWTLNLVPTWSPKVRLWLQVGLADHLQTSSLLTLSSSLDLCCQARTPKF